MLKSIKMGLLCFCVINLSVACSSEDPSITDETPGQNTGAAILEAKKSYSKERSFYEFRTESLQLVFIQRPVPCAALQWKWQLLVFNFDFFLTLNSQTFPDFLKIHGTGKPSTRISVSYTHLDVYKRQVKGSGGGIAPVHIRPALIF